MEERCGWKILVGERRSGSHGWGDLGLCPRMLSFPWHAYGRFGVLLWALSKHSL